MKANSDEGLPFYIKRLGATPVEQKNVIPITKFVLEDSPRIIKYSIND